MALSEQDIAAKMAGSDALNKVREQLGQRPSQAQQAQQAQAQQARKNNTLQATAKYLSEEQIARFITPWYLDQLKELERNDPQFDGDWRVRLGNPTKLASVYPETIETDYMSFVGGRIKFAFSGKEVAERGYSVIYVFRNYDYVPDVESNEQGVERLNWRKSVEQQSAKEITARVLSALRPRAAAVTPDNTNYGDIMSNLGGIGVFQGSESNPWEPTVQELDWLRQGFRDECGRRILEAEKMQTDGNPSYISAKHRNAVTWSNQPAGRYKWFEASTALTGSKFGVCPACLKPMDVNAINCECGFHPRDVDELDLQVVPEMTAILRAVAAIRRKEASRTK